MKIALTFSFDIEDFVGVGWRVTITIDAEQTRAGKNNPMRSGSLVSPYD
jgi:hypothetical protein